VFLAINDVNSPDTSILGWYFQLDIDLAGGDVGIDHGSDAPVIAGSSRGDVDGIVIFSIAHDHDIATGKYKTAIFVPTGGVAFRSRNKFLK
jgi:hypothetical protein